MTSFQISLLFALATAPAWMAQDKQTEATAKDVAISGQTAPSARETASTGSNLDAYIIGSADVLSITVWKETTLSGTMLVRPDGMISMPLLGDIQAAGMTPQQLSQDISSKLKKFIQEPSVSVVLSQIHSKFVYTLGEVGKKGPIEMTSGMTLLQAISSAGGLTDYANKGKIYILRVDAGKQARIPVRYKDALKGNKDLDVVLKAGDTIVVP